MSQRLMGPAALQSRRMWSAHADGWFAPSYRVEERGRRIGTIQFAVFGERGAIELDDRRFPIAREGFLWPSFSVRDGHKTLASAKPNGAFRRGYYVVHGEEEYRLNPGSWFGGRFDVTRTRGGQHMGQIRRVGVFARLAHVDLDPELATELRLFLLWLFLQAQRRRAR